MNNFDKTVPFDPGYSGLSFSFLEQMAYILESYNKIKANHQKKFWLIKFEPTIIDLINKSSAFYLGCMLWGGFIHERFKESPKEISGNNTNNMSKDEIEQLDCALEAKAILETIKNLDRDYKYFLKRSMKVENSVNEILENYIEFAQINNNFVNVNNTKDVKLPKNMSYLKDLSNDQLDNLCSEIHNIIESGKIETLLDLKN